MQHLLIDGMKNILPALATILLLGGGVFTEANAATIYKCVVAGRFVYSNIAADCAGAEKSETLAPVPVDKYPLDLGVRKTMGAADRAYLAGMSTVIPRYSIDPRDDLYGDPLPLVEPDLSRPEFSGNNPSGYHDRRGILNNPRIHSPH